MKCPVCHDEMTNSTFSVSESSNVNSYYCSLCACFYELIAENQKFMGWWKVIKLPVIPDDSDAKYRLYMIECICTGEVVESFTLEEFQNLKEHFANMYSSYIKGEGYEVVIAREDEFDEDGTPTFELEMDERILCHLGDCGQRLHEKAAKNVIRWRDILKL